MPQATKKGPQPVEDAAVNYAVDLYGRLRSGYGWRPGAAVLLMQEYSRFVRDAIACEFGVHAMWEYAQLVHATHQYLRNRNSPKLTARFHKRVCSDLRGIAMNLRNVNFDDQEKASMHAACERIEPLIKMWEIVNEARE